MDTISPLPEVPPAPVESSAQETPVAPPIFSAPIITPPTPKQQSFGAVISIVIIVLMIVLGAFYAWGKRVAEERAVLHTQAQQQ